MGQPVPYMSTGTVQPVKHRRKSRQKVWQAFRIRDIVLPSENGTTTADVAMSSSNDSSNGSGSSSSNGGSSHTTGPLIATIEVICGPSSPSQTTSTTTPSAATSEEAMAVSSLLLSPAVAVHAIDTTPLYFGKMNGANRNHLNDARMQLVSTSFLYSVFPIP